MRRHLLLWLTAAAVTAADLATKEAAFRAVPMGASREGLPGLLWITPRLNRGAAFSLLGGFEHSNLLLLLLSGVLVLLLTGLAYGKYRGAPMVAFGCVIGGAIGNMIDRLGHDGVRDFIDLRWWPVFNLADAGITTGVALLMGWSLFFAARKEIKPGRK